MDLGMCFEKTLISFFRDKAINIARQEANDKHRNLWVIKMIRRMQKSIDIIDTTLSHKNAIMNCIESVEGCIRSRKDVREVNYILFRLCGLLLGYRFGGARAYSLIYHQGRKQRLTECLFIDSNEDKYYDEYKSAIAIRVRTVKWLRELGHSDFKISLALNISEYEVKKIRKAEIFEKV